MRLWYEYLIPYLDNKRLIGQHRECCALRGKGWGRKHSVVNYVFEHHVAKLIQYHAIVMSECLWRGFNIDNKWMQLNYRGKNMPEFSSDIINNSSYWDNLNINALCKYNSLNTNEYINNCYDVGDSKCNKCEIACQRPQDDSHTGIENIQSQNN